MAVVSVDSAITNKSCVIVDGEYKGGKVLSIYVHEESGMLWCVVEHGNGNFNEYHIP